MSNTNSMSSSTISKSKGFAPLSEKDCQKLTELEQIISKETGKSVALVAYLV